MKIIKVSERIHKELSLLKVEKECSSFDYLLGYMLSEVKRSEVDHEHISNNS